LAETKKSSIYFFGGTLIVVLVSDMYGKAYASFSIKRFLNMRTIGVFNKVAGVGLIGFGLFMIGKVIVDMFT
jgi:threonine/homoserine/homoserine lactone efflux protein